MSPSARICYFVPGALSAHPGGQAEVRRREAFLQAHAAASTVVRVRDNPDGPASIESPEEEREAAEGLLRALPAAVADFDAVVIGCFGDPGLRAARQLVDVPVIGPAQAALHLAAQKGDRIGLLTVVDEVIPVLHDLVADYRMERSVATIRAVNVPVLRLRQEREAVLEKMAAGGRRCLDDGADVLVLGCMTMGFLGVADDLAETLGVPVVNPVLAGLHTAQAFLGLERGKTLTTAD